MITALHSSIKACLTFLQGTLKKCKKKKITYRLYNVPFLTSTFMFNFNSGSIGGIKGRLNVLVMGFFFCPWKDQQLLNKNGFSPRPRYRRQWRVIIAGGQKQRGHKSVFTRHTPAHSGRKCFSRHCRLVGSGRWGRLVSQCRWSCKSSSRHLWPSWLDGTSPGNTSNTTIQAYNSDLFFLIIFTTVH